MGYFDSFELVDDKNDLFITVRERSITFSKASIVVLHYAPYVNMYIDKKGSRAAFRENSSEGILFYRKPKAGRPDLVRISDKKKTRILLDAAGIADCGEKGVRFYGKSVPEEKVMEFDLSSPEIL